MLIGSTPIFSTLPCLPKLTLLCSPVQMTLSSDDLCPFDYPPSIITESINQLTFLPPTTLLRLLLPDLLLDPDLLLLLDLRRLPDLFRLLDLDLDLEPLLDRVRWRFRNRFLETIWRITNCRQIFENCL